MNKNGMHIFSNNLHDVAPRRRGFTLIELLVVISIILIVSSVIFIGGNSGDGTKLTSSQRILSGIAQGARGQALLKNADSRIIIYTDSGNNNEDEKKMRYFGIIYRDDEDPTRWVAATQGTFLPEGIYFDPDLSQSNNWTRQTMNIEFPRASPQSDTAGDEYYYYGFNSNGTMAENDNPWLVIRAGTLQPSGGSLEVDFSDESKSELKAALIFRRSGTTTPVNNPEDID